LSHIRSGGHLVSVGLAESTADVSPLQVDPDDWMYQSLTGRGKKRDLQPFTHEKAVDIAWDLYQRNPLAHRITNVNRDYIVGDGITWTAENPRVGKVMSGFWDDDVNRLEQRLPEFALEAGLFGELCLQVLQGESTGVVRLGYIDPSQIADVVPLEGNPLVLDQVVLKKKVDDSEPQRFDIVRERDGKLAGDVFFLKLNSVSNSTRGWPDMLHIADWLDFYDQLLWDMAERSRLMRTFIWDVQLEGDETAVQNFLRKNGTAPKTGSVRAHNKSVEWKPVAPQLGSFEVSEELNVLLTHLAAGAGLPKHWLANAGDVNRATALEMGAPTIRRLAQRQKQFLDFIRTIIRFVLQEALGASRIPNRAGKVQTYASDGTRGVWRPPHELITIHAPEISLKDQRQAANMLEAVAAALQIAQDKGWMSVNPIRTALSVVLAELGVDYDPSIDTDLEPVTAPAPVPSVPGSPEPTTEAIVHEVMKRMKRRAALAAVE
jgi:hypothetical protein